MSPLPRAVLLDMDDTILDDSGSLDACWRLACERYGRELGSIAPAVLHEAIDRTRDWYWADPERHRAGRLGLRDARQEVVRLALADLGRDDAALAAAIADAHSDAREEHMSPCPGAFETVDWLRASGCRLALVTNGGAAMQRAKIDRFDIASRFDVVLVEGEIGYGKPDPRIYERAFRELDVEPASAWMVGDNLEFDVAGPQQLGATGIWIDLRGAGVPPDSTVRPHRIIRTLSELRNS
jgi:putative hydrolase of the HAD superfamily